MFVRTSIAVLAAALIIQTGAAFAQPAPQPPPGAPPAAGAPPAPGGHREHRGGMSHLFSSLNLTDAQKAKVQAISQKYRQQNQNVTDPQQRHTNMRAQRDEMMAVLTPDQKQKLQSQIQQMRQRRPGGPDGQGPGGAAPGGPPRP